MYYFPLGLIPFNFIDILPLPIFYVNYEFFKKAAYPAGKTAVMICYFKFEAKWN